MALPSDRLHEAEHSIAGHGGGTSRGSGPAPPDEVFDL
jgi:hypothetical protein